MTAPDQQIFLQPGLIWIFVIEFADRFGLEPLLHALQQHTEHEPELLLGRLRLQLVLHQFHVIEKQRALGFFIAGSRLIGHLQAGVIFGIVGQGDLELALAIDPGCIGALATDLDIALLKLYMGLDDARQL